MRKYKTLKLNEEEIAILKRILMQQIVNTKIEQTNIEEERELTVEEELKYKSELNDYQNLLRLIRYIER